ncbi:SDR family oxidoreductase [Sphingomonadaceae bacterium G21617-S1]|nr:SDR family oxidoreductase [Sphingomonadaceae bacterium G21617-S1]
MKVLLIGAYGFIGSEIARALIAAGHDVRGFGRDVAYGRRILPMVEWVRGDLVDFTGPGQWAPLLSGVDAVINASGLLQDEPGHSVVQVQQQAIAQLAVAAGWANLARFIQISAANAEADAPGIFLASKAAADAKVRELGPPHIILRPGLVIGRNAYGGTALIRIAAAMPGVALLPGGTGPIQCIAMTDLVAAALRALDPAGPEGSCDLVEARPRSLGEIVALHRGWLGLPPARCTVYLPGWAMRLVGAVADALGWLGWRSPLRSNALLSLRHGISGDPAQAEALLGRPACPLESVLAGQPAGPQDRLSARLGLLLPAMLLSLFLMWFGSALFTLLDLGRAAALLIDGGLPPATARLLGGGGALIDGAIALLLLHRRTVRPALVGTIAATLAYLAGACLLRPDFWIDPLAPLLKTLPAAMLSLACLTLTERR